MNGTELMGQMKQAGFSDDEITTWRDATSKQMSSAGFAQDEVSSYFGVNPNPDMSKTTSAIQANVDAHVAQNVDPEGKPKPLSFTDAIQAGYGSSVTGLLESGKVPTEMSGNEPWYTRTAFQVAQLYGDAPAMIAGAIGGGVAGGAAGSAVPVIGTTVGGVAGAGAGAFAVPTYIREALIDGYRNGGFKSFGDYWDRMGPILLHTSKSAVVGAATAGAGGAAGGALEKMAAPSIVQKLGVTAAEVATVATMGKAIDGQMPTFQDFTDAAILIGGMKAIGATPKGAAAVKAKLENTFIQTGVKPTQIVSDAPGTPSIAQDLADPKQDVPTAYGGKREPYLTPPEEKAAPAIVDAYHGTNKVFDLYGEDKSVASWREALGGRMDGKFYFTDDPKIASTYADGDGTEGFIGNVRPVKLDTTNWHEVDAAGATGDARYEVEFRAMDYAMEHGKDGVIMRNVVDPINHNGTTNYASGETAKPSTVYIAFRRNQIRSRFEEPFASLPESHQTPEVAQAKILSQINVGGKSADKPGLTGDKLYTAFVDDLNPIKKAVEKMAQGETIPTAENPYEIARLSRGAYGKAEQFLERGTFDFNTYETDGKGLKDILAPVRDDLDGARAYLASRRAIELEGRGIEHGFDIDAARQVVAAGGERYAKVTADLDTYQDNVLRYGRDSGLFTDAAYEAMRDANKAYIPFNRVIEGVDQGGIGMGLQARNPIKRIKGSDLKVVDPLESVIRNTYTMVAMAERNSIATSFYKLASKAEEPGQFFKEVAPPIRPIEVSDPEMAKFFKENGIDSLPEDALTVFRAVRQPLAKDEIGFFDEGKWKVLQVDPDLAEAFSSTDSQFHGLLFDLLKAPARGLRAGSALVPDFLIRHGARIELTSFVYSQNGYIPFFDRFTGLVERLKKGDAYDQWQKGGGANAAMISMDRDYIQSEIFHLIDSKPETNFVEKAWNTVTKPFEWLRVTQEVLEDATRMAEVKRAMAGAEPTKANIQSAAMDSRDLSIDSSRIGSSTRNINAMAGFFNSHLQHNAQILTALAERPIPTLAKIFAAVTVPSIALWMNNHDDPRYQELPSWQKDLFWIIPTKDHIFRIPKPFELGVLFGSGVEHILDAIYPPKEGHDPQKDLGAFGIHVLGAAFPSPVPTVAVPILEQITNHSFFEDRPLIPSSKEKLLPEFQYNDYTTELTKQMGHLIGTVPGLADKSISSPLVIDNYVSQWTGTLGVYMNRLADLALRKAGVLPDPNKPTGTLADVPVVRAFVVRYPSATAQSIQDFREDYAKRAMVYATVQSLAKEGNVEAATRVMQVNPAMMAKLDGIERALGTMTNTIHLIDQNPEMKPDEKRQVIDGIYYQMIEMTKAGNAGMRALDKQFELPAH